MMLLQIQLVWKLQLVLFLILMKNCAMQEMVVHIFLLMQQLILQQHVKIQLVLILIKVVHQ